MAEVSSTKLSKSKSRKNSNSEPECQYRVQPIHKRQDLVDETIKLINSFWPKTRAERLSILGSSKDNLPLSLIMTVTNKSVVCSESGAPVNVLGHLRLVPVPADRKACFIESTIIHPDFRGKGLGTFFLKQAEKFCEEKLHLKSIHLSTYDSGEFYMKIGFELTTAICVYGNGEVNNVSKKIYLKKTLNYVEPEPIEEEDKEADVYDPTKDYNYIQQKQMENDVIVSGFPFKIDRAKCLCERLCEILNFPSTLIKYYYSYDLTKRETGERTFHMMISCVTQEAKVELLTRFSDFGTMCFQHFYEKPVNEWDNTLITVAERFTNLNYIILKELAKLKLDRWISDYMYVNCQFQAKQADEWIIVKNLEVIEQLRTPELPDVPDDKIEIWSDEEEPKDPNDLLKKMKDNFKSNDDESWLVAIRKPSLSDIFAKGSNEVQQKSWVDKVRHSNDAITLGLVFSDY